MSKDFLRLDRSPVTISLSLVNSSIGEATLSTALARTAFMFPDRLDILVPMSPRSSLTSDPSVDSNSFRTLGLPQGEIKTISEIDSQL